MRTHTVKLGEVAVVKGGKRLPKGVGLITTPNSHPYIRVRDLNGKCPLELNNTFEFVDDNTQATISKYTVNSGDIVLSIVGTIGLVSIVGSSLNRANLTENCVKLTALPNIDRDFLYYFLKSPYGQQKIAQGTVGAVQAKLPIKNIQNIEINLPDIKVQKEIASILSSLDNKIFVNDNINDNLEEQSKVIFDKLFPNISDGSYTVGDYITPKRGKNLLSKNAVQGNVPVVAGGLVPSVYHNTSNTKAPVLAISASGANAGYVSLWNIPIWASDSSYIDSSMTNNVYFWYVLLKKRQKEIFDAQTGSAQPHIYPQHIAGMPIKELEVAKIQEFNAMVTPIFEKIGKNLKENTQLETLRDILLPKLMSGEIDISAVQF